MLGWAASTHYLPLIGYLAVGPGIVGHTGGRVNERAGAQWGRGSRANGAAEPSPMHALKPAVRSAPLAAAPLASPAPGFNTLLRHLDPLIISLACNLEPLIGSLLGYAAGVVPPPGAWTYLGGALIMLSTAVVSLASHRREQRQRQQEQQVAAGKDGGGSAAAAAAAADGEEAPLVAATAAAADIVRPPWRSDSAAEGSWGRLPGQPEQQRGALPPDRPSVP